VLERAEELLGEAWRRRQQVESEAEAALTRLSRAEEDLAREREAARAEAERLAAESGKLALERTRMLEEGLAGFERARRQLRSHVEGELSRVRADS